MKVVVIGGGWAGLAAAVKLAKHGYTVSILEASRQLGGRARAIKFGSNHVDNGQHIMLGAYNKLLEVLKEVGVKEENVLKRLPLDLKFAGSGKARFHLRTRKFPAPVHLLIGLLGAHGLGIFDRLAVLKAVIRMRASNFKVPHDIALIDYMEQLGQTEKTIKFLWQPLCISVLNTPIDTASTELFLNVIRDAFFGKSTDSDILLPLNHLNACFPDPAMEYVEKMNGSISLGTRVESINIANNSVVSIKTNKGKFNASKVVLATSPEQAHILLKEHEQLKTIAQKVGDIKSLPITTLYLRYPEPVSLGREFIGFLDNYTQWVFDRDRLTGDTAVLAVVISGPGKHMKMTTAELTEVIINEIAFYYPDFPRPIETKLIREKMATLSSSVGINNNRVRNVSPVKGFWLAGDYTDTGYPSTLEGAVRSGLDCAQAIIGNNNTQ